MFIFDRITEISKLIASALYTIVYIAWPYVIMCNVIFMKGKQCFTEIIHKLIELINCPIPLILSTIFNNLSKTGGNCRQLKNLSIRILLTLRLKTCLNYILGDDMVQFFTFYFGYLLINLELVHNIKKCMRIKTIKYLKL